MVHGKAIVRNSSLLLQLTASVPAGTGVLPAVVPFAIEALKSPAPALRRLSVRQLGRALQVNYSKEAHCINKIHHRFITSN